MRRQQTTKKHIVEPEQIGYKKQNNGSGYSIQKYTRMFNYYWGNYTLIVTDLSFGVSTVLFGNHEPVDLYRDK